MAPIPEVKSLGDPAKKYVREIAKVCERLYKTSLAALEKGGIPIVLGGDHSLAAGSVAATADFVSAGEQASGPHMGGRARRSSRGCRSPSGGAPRRPAATRLSSARPGSPC